jgi:AraC-like DNA-binding protein
MALVLFHRATQLPIDPGTVAGSRPRAGEPNRFPAMTPPYLPAQPIARRLASQSSVIRLRLPGAEAVLAISIKSSEADLVRGPLTMIDLTDSELGGEQLAGIMRWLSERLQVHSDALRPFAPTGLAKWRLKRVLTHIDEHFCESITLATLAQVARLSRMYFAARFRAATGCRPHEYILRKRIECAKQLLLETSEPIASIALAVGFQSQAHFSTVFKRFVGLSPSRWRPANCDVRSVGRAPPSEGTPPPTAARWSHDARPSRPPRQFWMIGDHQAPS